MARTAMYQELRARGVGHGVDHSMMLLPPDKVRMGAGLINIMQQGIGGMGGLAAMTTLLEHSTAYHHAVLEQQQGSSSLAWGEIPAPVRVTVAAYQDRFVLVTVLCVVVMPFVLFLRRPPAE